MAAPMSAPPVVPDVDPYAGKFTSAELSTCIKVLESLVLPRKKKRGPSAQDPLMATKALRPLRTIAA